MNLDDEATRESWRSHLGGIFAGRPVIAGFGPLAQYAGTVSLLRAAGARRPMLVVNGRGAGPVPAAEEAAVVHLERRQFSLMTEELRAHDRIAHDLPADVVASVESYDPHREGVWFMSPFVVDEPILGRPVLGGRPAAWLQLEDKLLANDIWRAVGAPHAEASIVPVDLPRLRQASEASDRGEGVVWAGDARDGFNGGGEFVRWVATEDDARAAYAFFASRCDRVRVMPFLEGVPCSIHGMVLPDGTATFRPVELAILRDLERRQFVYGGQGSTWDPPDQDREQMRELARSAGEHLRARVGYRGAFGIDGVLSADGFRPTEVNTRLPGGLNGLAGGLDADLFLLLQVNLVAGRDPRVGVAELESWAVTAFDAQRFAKPIAISDRVTVEDAHDVALAWDGERLARCGPEDANVRLMLGPTSIGIYTRLTPLTPLQPGERVALLNVALMRFLDEEYGTAFGPVEAPPDVRVHQHLADSVRSGV